EKTIIPFFENLTAVLKAPGMSEMDCGQGIAQATLVAFEEGLGTCLLGSKLLEKLPKALGLPPQARVLVLQTVGYPAEDVYRSGQRPRLPFDRLFHLNHFDTPFPRDPAVVKELETAGLIQFVGPDDRARRDHELAELQATFDYPPL
ncbi:MAG: nitroreductase family protein, partial [Deltaproteobacteria bacterium]|nr:nitroreductase family protein [Deltaproteobacteria bacterium]